MLGLMMDRPLLISSLIEHAAECHGDTEIVSHTGERTIHRYTYRAARDRSRRLANALVRLGVGQGDRVGTLAWNGHRHFEVYYAVSGMGAVCHTINPRLFHEQIAFIVNHAEDRLLFVDPSLLPLAEQLWPRFAGVRGVVLMADRAHMPAASAIPDLLCYEDLVGAESDRFDWPVLDERTASSLCYTSGTTGDPKGVLYSHRANVLHSYAVAAPDNFDMSARDSVLPIVPMFHANAWGIPYVAALVGAKLVLPGPHLDGESLHRLIKDEGVTMSAAVPTVWMGLLQYLEKTGQDLKPLSRCGIGGSACPRSMIETLWRDYGVQVRHGWGMTELSPVGTANTPLARHRDIPDEARFDVMETQGRAIFGVDMRIVDADGRAAPHDGRTFGDLQVRGPWVASGYFRLALSAAHGADGWFSTGDVATIDPDGYLRLVDRTKDVIKSGGEWISSVELENLAVGHPAVAEAAVIGVPHPRWAERPLLLAVLKPGAMLTREALLAFLEGKVARWWLPDDVVFVDDLPHTATGKLHKARLRELYAGHVLPAAAGARAG